jgi:DNA-directed RNA polymerase
LTNDALIDAREKAIEESMVHLGQERYWSLVQSARRRQKRTDTPAGRQLLKHALGLMEDAVAAWMAKALAGPARSGHSIVYVRDFDPAVLAFLVVRGVLDMAGHEVALTAAAHSVASILEEEAHFVELRKKEPVLWRDLKRRMRRTRSKQTRAHVLASAGEHTSTPFSAWPRRDKIRLGVTMIELARMHTGLIETRPVSMPNGRVKFMLSATEDALKWLEEADEAHALLFPFHLPTLVPPLDWRAPTGGGYHSDAVVRRPFIKTRDGEVHADSRRMGEVYKAANVLQRTGLVVNARVLETMLHFWRAGTPVAGLPARVDEPPIAKVDREGASAAEYKAYRAACAARHKRVVASRSQRIMAAKIVFMAERLKGEPEFFFPYQADFRGRVYPIPFFLQPQGPGIARGLLCFSKGKPIRDKVQAQWFRVHGANTFGVDKASFRQRVEWTAVNHERIMRTAADPIGDRWWADADKPWEFLAWALEYSAWCHSPATFKSRVPVAMDGSNNGLQIFSLLMRDPIAAEATNVLPTEAPRDIYQDVADRVTADLVRLSISGDAEQKADAAKWIEFTGGRVPRAAVKRQVMTLPYGSTFHACIHYTRDWYEEVRKGRGGATPFKRGYDPSVYLARLVWSAIGDTVGSARACMEWLREIASLCSNAGKFVRWHSPSGFPVKQPYRRFKSSRVKTSIGERVRWSRIREDTDKVDAKRQANGVSPNFVHSLDAAALVKAVNRAKERGVSSFITVHDSYGVLAADAPAMARTLREVYAEMFDKNLLDDFKAQVEADTGLALPEPPARGDLDVSKVTESEYFFA